MLDHLDDHVDGHDHFEFNWVPNTRWALTKHNRRTDEPTRPRPRWREVRDDILINNLGFDAVMRVGRWRNDLLPKAAKRLPSTGRADYIDASYKVFASPRLLAWASISAQKSLPMISASGHASCISKARSPVPVATSSTRAGFQARTIRATFFRHKMSVPRLSTWFVVT